MSSNNKHKSDKPNTPKKFENRARQAATIASYADNQEPSNKKSISEEARQKVARIYDVFDGKWKKEDILRSLEEHDLDEQATIWAKTEGKDEWKDVPSKRRVEQQKKFKKPNTDDENTEGGDASQSVRGRGGFRGGRGGRGRGTRGGYRGGKPTSYADRAAYKSTNYRGNDNQHQQQQQQQVVEEAPAIVTPAKPLYSEIAKKRKELDELAAAEKLAKEHVVEQPAAAVVPEPTQEQAVTKKQPRNKKKKQDQQPQQEEVAPAVTAPEESPYGEDEPVAPTKPKKMNRKYVAVAQQQPAVQQVTTVVADAQEVVPEPQEVEEEEPEVVLPNTQYNNIDLKFGAFADGEAPVEVAAPVTQEVPAPTTTSNTTQTSQYGYGSWNQQPTQQPAQDNYFYDDKAEVQPQQQQGEVPQTGKQQQQFKGYPQQTFMPQQYHQYGYPYHPYMMNFQYQGGYPNPSKPYPYYAQKNMYAYPSYGTQPATNAANQGYPYPDPESAAAAADYGKYQNVPAFYGVPPQQQQQGYDAPTTKQTRGGPQQAQGSQTGKDKRGQPTSEDFAAYNNYMHHYNYAMAYPYAQQGYPAPQQQQQHRGAPHQQQGKGDWNPAYNQTQ